MFSHDSQTCGFAQPSGRATAIFLPSGVGCAARLKVCRGRSELDGRAISAPEGAVCPEDPLCGTIPPVPFPHRPHAKRGTRGNLALARWGAGCYHLGVRVYLFAVDGVCVRVWALFLSVLPSSSVAVGVPPLWTPPSHGLISLPTDLEFPVHVSPSTPTTATAKDFAYTLPCM